MGEPTRGKDFKIYLNTDDPYDSSPTWVEYTNVKDVTRNDEKTMADASTRLTSVRQQVSTMRDFGLDLQSVYVRDDALLALLKARYLDEENIEVLDLDGDIQDVGTLGVRFMAQVSKFTVNEGLEDVGLVDISLVPGFDQDNIPRGVHVTSPGTVTDD